MPLGDDLELHRCAYVETLVQMFREFVPGLDQPPPSSYQAPG